jgi:nitrous-oxide reductase
MKAQRVLLVLAALAVAAGIVRTLACGVGHSAGSDAAKGASLSSGEEDQYYAFLSGGRSGSVFVAGIPSGRLIREIPVFEPRAAYGYASNEGDPRRDELRSSGGLWGDTHQPALSETGGACDGRYLFIDDLANARLGRVRLDTFETDRIARIPNLQGAHGIAVVPPDTRYIVVNGEFEQPTDGAADSPEPYTSVVAFVDPETMETKFEVRVPGNAVMADASRDGRFVFSTISNLEQGRDSISMMQFDRDAVAAIDVPAAEKAAISGKASVRNGVPVLELADSAGVLTLIPVPKNPQGINVTPDGRYAIAAGRLSPTVTVIDARTLQIVAEPEVGPGPLATTFDDRGNAYTSLYVGSEIVEWNIARAVRGASDYVVGRVPVHYNVGSLQATRDASAHPRGEYLLALNTSSKDRYLPVGPETPQNFELIDISGEQMKMLGSFPTLPEPQGVELVAARILAPKVRQTLEPPPDAVQAGHELVVRTGPRSVTVQMTAIHSVFTPDHFEVREGDRVTFRLTNVETMRDRIHGFGLPDHDLHVSLPPGATRTITIDAGRPGVYWYYCTHFCGVLHPEMRGRMIVHPQNAMVALSDWRPAPR